MNTVVLINIYAETV